MSVCPKISGAWKQAATADSCYVKVSGEWKKCSQVYIKVNGAWKRCYETYSTGTKTVNWSCPLSKITLTDVKPNTKIYITGTFQFSGDNALSFNTRPFEIPLTGCRIPNYSITYATVDIRDVDREMHTGIVGVNGNQTVTYYTYSISPGKVYNLHWFGYCDVTNYGTYTEDIIASDSTVTIGSSSLCSHYYQTQVNITITYTYEKYS